MSVRSDNAVVQNHNRLLMAFQRIVFPDGREFAIAGQPGVEDSGSSGFSGDVEPHRGSVYAPAFLLTLLGTAESLLVPQNSSVFAAPTITQSATQAAGAQLNCIGNSLLARSIGDETAALPVRKRRSRSRLGRRLPVPSEERFGTVGL
jgi:type IV secretory pathway VirB10-like protein